VGGLLVVGLIALPAARQSTHYRVVDYRVQCVVYLWIFLCWIEAKCQTINHGTPNTDHRYDLCCRVEYCIVAYSFHCCSTLVPVWLNICVGSLQ